MADGVVDAVVGGTRAEAEGQSADWHFVSPDFLKATPHTEGERRFVHFEASNDALDQEGERILKSALFADRAFYLEKGNIDLEHLTILGYRMVDPATGRLLIKNPRDYEIGLPVEVRDTAHVIFAKGGDLPGPRAGRQDLAQHHHPDAAAAWGGDMKTRPEATTNGSARTRSIEAASSSHLAGPACILRVDQVMARTALSRTTLWRLERRGAFPERRQLSPGAVGWVEAEVEEWILSRTARSRGAGVARAFTREVS